MKELLDHQFEHTYAEGTMAPSVSEAVRGLTSTQAAWKPSPSRHSIWQIVRHLAHWKEAALRALDGDPVEYYTWSKADWQEIAGDDAAWQADVGRLHEVSMELRARLQAMDEATLAAPLSWYRGRRSVYPVARRLLWLGSHDLYHAGQIQYVFALQAIPVEELVAAASVNDLARLERLVREHPEVVNAFPRDGWTALHLAAYLGRQDAVRFLLERGASPGVASRNEEGQTALHAAIMGVGDRRATSALLLQYGADVQAKDGAGQTALDLARRQGDADLVEFLEDALR